MHHAAGGAESRGERDSMAAVLRRLAVPVYAPTVLEFAGEAATLPILPLIALSLGFSVPEAAALGLIGGVMSVIGNVPIGRLMRRWGTRRSTIVSGIVLVAVNLGLAALIATGVPTGGSFGHRAGLVASLVVVAACTVVWTLSRQAYLAEYLPARMRARGMTTLGGAMRLGQILGPLIASVVLIVGHQSSVFVLSAVLIAIGTACVFSGMEETGDDGGRAPGSAPAGATAEGDDAEPHAGSEADAAASEGPVTQAAEEPPTVTSMIHRRLTFRDLASVGAGILPLAMARANRPVIVPLMGAALGLGESDIALIFGIAAIIEILLFYPAGVIMDRWGRVAAVVPCMAIVALGFAISAPYLLGDVGFDAGTWAFGILLTGQIVMGIGNGLGSGIMMTLGVDMTNHDTRTRDLARWNTIIGSGRLFGPLVVAGVTLVAPIGWAALVMTATLVGGAGWLARTLPRYGLGR